MKEMKMSDVFDAGHFDVYHHAEIVDTSRYAYIEHNEIQIESSEYINHAVQSHDRLQQENAELRDALESIKVAADCVTQYKHALSYNESYAGEPMGEMKNNLAELDAASCKAIQLLSKLKKEGE